MTATLILLGLEGLLVAAAWAAGARTKVSLALTLLCFTAPLEVYRADIGPGNLSLFRLSLALAMILALIDHRRAITASLRSPMLIAFGALVALMLVSAVSLSDNRELARSLVSQSVLCIVAASVIATLARNVPWWHLIHLIVLGSALPLLAAAAEGILGSDGTFSLPLLDHLPVPAGLEVTRQDISFLGDRQRLRGTFGDPNHFGAYLAFVAALGTALFARARMSADTRATLTYGALTIGSVAALAATLSRSAWAGAVVAVVIAGVLVASSAGLREQAVRRWRIGAVGALLALIVMAPLAPTIIDRLDSDRAENRMSSDVHGETTKVAFETLGDHPVFGVGVADLGPILGEGPRTSGAHSSYLTVGSETGGMGLLAMLVGILFVLGGLWRACQATRDVRDLLPVMALLAAYVGFLVSNGLYDLWWDDFHWVVLGAVTALAIRSPTTSPPWAFRRGPAEG